MQDIKYNKLKNELSPYLLQHADNPVEWYLWGEEAFEKAREEDKPIFLSIGYSTCHWCHVMAHESFEDEEVASLMNEVFVSIKVDREERPDIDSIYMTACQMMTGRGGWPLTIFLTPDKKPFFAATYIPKESRFGMMGMKNLIKRIKTLWNSDKKKLLDSAEQITFSLQNITTEAPGESLTERALKNAYNQLANQFDKVHGGFSNAPKFPKPHNLLFLLRFWKRTGNNEALEMVEKTLLEMRRGGVYDHVGFGFHRYSTDAKWHVPHFEKMLYDQSLLALAYTEAYLATKKMIYRKTAEEIISYVLRDMTSPEGGFYSAEDADSEGVEGKFYAWTKQEIESILDAGDAEFTVKLFNIEESGNYLEEAVKHKTGNNILYLKKSIQEIAKEMNIEVKSLKKRIETIRKRLFEIREKRIHPHKDDKILTDWNGLMIAALARAGRAFKEPLYIDSARRSVEFIMNNLRKENGRLLHRYRDNEAKIDAYLNDHAFFIWGLLELYESNFDVKYLRNALELHDDLLEHFWDDNIGGFYFNADNSEELLVRQKEIHDGAIPSGNSIAFLNLLKLSYITGDTTLEEKADILSRVFANTINSNPIAHAMFMVAVDFAVGPTYSLVVAGKTNNNDTVEMIETINDHYLPNKVFLLRKMDQSHPDIDDHSNFVQYFEDLNGKATTYACINKTCKIPTQDIDKIIEYLKPNWIKK